MGIGRSRILGLCVALAVLALPAAAHAEIDGITGPQFNLVARPGHITTPDGASHYSWGFANGAGEMQYPGPTLIVNQGDVVTITLTNQLPASAGNVSVVIPGMVATATGGVAGLVTREAEPGGMTPVTYTFTADRPGTFSYYSGGNTSLHVDMGLVGALIVRPATVGQAYDHLDSAYDHEYLFLLTEMDPLIHRAAELSCSTGVGVETSGFWPQWWFINGRAAPDTMAEAFSPLFPNQPYNCLPRMLPGERVLMRVIDAGRDRHPFHHHGNHATVIARNGGLLSSAPGNGADLAYGDFTIGISPGETVDAIFTWTGEALGWDVYGHAPGDPLQPGEYAPDHGKPLPVQLPANQNLTLGGFYSGSPFLGGAMTLPPGEGGMNPNSAFTMMWHSHTEKEMTNGNIFPGGMMTMAFIEPPGTIIP